MDLNPDYERMRAAEDAPRDRFYLLERRHCLAEIVERGAIFVERLSVQWRLRDPCEMRSSPSAPARRPRL